MTSNASESDATTTIVQLAMGGDQDAFGKLIDQYSGMVTGVTYSVLGDFDRSEDAGQEAFLEAWKKRATLKDPAKFASWICSIARHRALDLVRHRARAETVNRPLADADVASNEPDVDEAVLKAEEKALVWNSLDGLPPKYRDVMVLYYRGDESVAAVAESLGESESTIRQRLHRGREMLRTEVEAIVRRTLHGTAPKAVFTAVVLGSLPGNAYAATAGAASVGTGKAAVAGTALSGAAIGGILGALGGLIGGGFGAWQTYRTSPYAAQRRLVIGYSIFACLLSATFAVLLWWLISLRTSETPMPNREYANRLMTLIFGFQGIFLLSSLVFIVLYRRAKTKAKEAGENVVPEYANTAQGVASPKRQYTSPGGLWGRPWIDVQFAERTEDQTIVDLVPARGWIAIGNHAHGRFLAVGDRAIGMVAVGGQCIGLIAIGGICCGLISLGGLAMGGLALGGLAIGGLACGGLAIGNQAIGGGAFGWSAAKGGGVWSRGYAEGGHVISGSSEPGTAELLASGWLFQFSNLDAWNPIAIECAIVIGVAMFCGVLLAQVATNNLFSTSSESSEDKQSAHQARMGGAFGSLLGGSVWIAFLGMQSENWFPGVIPLTLYLIAAVFTWRMYVRSTNADMVDEPRVPVVAFTKALIALNVATTLGLIYLSVVGFQQLQSYLWLSTAWLVSQVIYATNAFLIRIVLGADGSPDCQVS